MKLTDVARLADVSVATVSRVLNGSTSVDADLAARVREAAARLDYRANGVARSLRRRRTDVWALLISDVADPFFTAVARGVEDVAQHEGFSVVLCNTDEDPEKERTYLAVAEREQVAGVILSPNEAGSDISRLSAGSIPVVAIDRSLGDPVDTVLVDSAAGAQEATEHLFAQGWRRPACVTGPRRAETARARLLGYRRAWSAAGVRPVASLVRHTDFHTEQAQLAVAALLDGRAGPDSFFLANSSMALGALRELSRRGIAPGRDVGLIAFDDAPWTPFVSPPLSVVAQPAYDIGVTAARLLVDRVRLAPVGPARRVVLSTQLVVRGSSLRADGA